MGKPAEQPDEQPEPINLFDVKMPPPKPGEKIRHIHSMRKASEVGFRSMDPEQLLDAYANWRKNAEKTRKVYRRHVAEFVRWLEGFSVWEVDRKIVKAYAGHLEFVREPTLAPNSQRAHLAAISNFYAWLRYVDEDFHGDPGEGVEWPKLEREPGLVLSMNEVEAILNVRRGTARDRVQAFLLTFTAGRVGELRGLRWSHVNWTEGTIQLFGKTGHRKIPIHARLVEPLKMWETEQMRWADRHPGIALALQSEATSYVLLTKTGRQISEGELWRSLKQRAWHAGVLAVDHMLPAGERTPANRSQVTPHALRRTMATTLLRAGIPLDSVSTLLGHKNLNTTRDWYAFSDTARERHSINSFLPQPPPPE